MSIPGKLVIAIAIGLVAAALAPLLTAIGAFDPVLAVLFVAATAGTALITHRPLTAPAAGTAASGPQDHPEKKPRSTPRREKPAAKKKPAAKQKSAATAPSGPREEATVKWFNAAKGFGFLTLDDGR